MVKIVEEKKDIRQTSQSQKNVVTPESKVKLRFNPVVRGVSVALLVIFVFTLGLGVGSGRIHIGSSSQKSLPNNFNYQSVEDLYDNLKRNFDGSLDGQKLLDGIKAGLVEAAGDPYTEYLTPKEAQEFSESLSGSFQGIGAELGKDPNGNVVIIAPISNTPAEKAGLLPKDVVVKVNGEDATGWSVEEAKNKIRGEAGTVVKLTVVRDGQKEVNLEITREQINIPSVESKIINGNIGYIKISRFSEDSYNLVNQAAQDFKKAGVKGVVLDVRNDPGGLLDAAVDVSGIWLPQGKVIVREKQGDVVKQTFVSKGPATLDGVPTVVLINSGSASASEIVAGALKDNNAATLVGEKSFGKGSVQQLINLPGGGVLKVTIAKWYTPNDKNINKDGIEPDQKVERTEDDFKAQKDPQLDTAIQKLSQ